MMMSPNIRWSELPTRSSLTYWPSACGVDYEKASRSGIEIKDVGGVLIPVASKQLLIETKQTIRSSDAADVLFLRTRIEADENFHSSNE